MADPEKWDKAQNFDDFLQLNQEFISRFVTVDKSEWVTPPWDYTFINVNSSYYEGFGQLDVFVYSSTMFKGSGGRANRYHLSFWCPESTNPLKLIRRLRERSDIVVYATKLHPYEVVEGTPTEGIYTFRNKKGIETQYSKIYARDVSKEYEFWQLENVRLLKPWLVDVVALNWNQDVDLTQLVREAIDQCGWSKDH